jgi:Protein of unknown function (DUF4242)
MDAANGSGMRSYLVEVYQPRIGADAAAARARSAADAVSRAGTPVRYVRSIFVPEDETCFHVFEAPSAAAIVEASRRASVPFLRVTEAIG